MSDFQLTSKSEIKDRQMKFLSKRASSYLDSNAGEIDEDAAVRDIQDAYEEQIGNPLFQKRRAERHQLPFMEEMQANMEEVTADLGIISNEHQSASLFLKNAFNAVHSEKKRLTQRIDTLNSLTGDLLLLTGDSSENTIYLKESFQNSDALDHDFTSESISKAAIHTGEGILTLGRAGSVNLSKKSRVSHISGNGKVGVENIARKFTVRNRNQTTSEEFRFINENNPKMHTQLENVLDDRPDTIFEYQMINVPESFKKDRRYYDFDWAKGKKEEERLRLKIVIELDEEEDVNWITLHPYYANNAEGRIIIRSIQTSLDGFDFLPLYQGKLELNETINATPQTYRMDELFDGESKPEDGNYSGKGVWSFPHRKARFIEFLIDQPQSYPEIVGQAVYSVVLDSKEYPIQVPEPEELKTSPPGEYVRSLDGQRMEYKKEVQATSLGWRHAIGLRNIKIMQYQFDDKSHFVSKRHELPREAERLVLYSKELIPESFLDVVSKNNDWIQYEVTFDDIEWIRISPMHHEPLNDNFPPKILEVNNSSIELTQAFQIHKAFVQTEEEATFVRMRITMQRPEGEEFTNETPILEDVALKVNMKGDF